MDIAELLKAAIGFLLGAAGSYIGLHWKVKKELEGEYDKELRAERIKSYSALWKILQPLAKYARPAPVTTTSLQELTIKLRKWYFEVGGIFMSTNAREAYFALQDSITTSIASMHGHSDRKLSDADFEKLRILGSRLRTATTVDIGTRKKPLMTNEASA